MKPTLLGLSFSIFAGVCVATQGQWQQCGGIGWTGGTDCVAGTVCTNLNSYYFQCLPGIASTPAASASSAAPTGKPITSFGTTTASQSRPVTITSASPAHPTSPINPNVNYWFSFGDSYTQTGFTTTGAQPSINNPLGNPPYPGYTAVGGVNWIDVATIQYNKSLLLTYNYAYGGATIDASLVQPYESTVLSLTDQVNEFLNSSVASRPATAPWTASNSLFSFWIGINDIGNSYYQSGDRDANIGARNFLFINVPPIDRSPLMLAQAASAQALEKTVIAGYNSKLAQRVAAFQASTGSQTWIWDSNTDFTAVLNDPQDFGFNDAVSYGAPGDFWGNNYHPSADAQTIWGERVAGVLAGTVW